MPQKNSVAFIYISIDEGYSFLDSNERAHIPAKLINGSRLCVTVFFQDHTLLAPICFNSGEYTISDIIDPENLEYTYSTKSDWGRYKIIGDTIYTEVVKPWYNPSVHYEMRYDNLLFINDSTIEALPSVHRRDYGSWAKVAKSNGYLNSLKSRFHKIDSIDLNYLDPSEAWINKVKGKRQFGK